MSPTYHLTTLGCAKNQVDSEKLDAMLAEAGYVPADDPEQADVVMVNTCAFIEDARRESVETILEVQEARRPGARTVVVGCMAQRFGVDVAAALPEVDAVLGIDRYGELVPTLDRLTGTQPVSIRRRPAMDILHAVDRPAPSLPYAYVKVAEGCDKPCTFCAIPLIRGKQRSRRPIEIRTEVERLVDGGVSEVILVSQDLAAYGRDLGPAGSAPNSPPATRRPELVSLLHSLSEISGLARLRLLYLYPREIRPALITEMADNPKVASYFDLSLQHSETRLLRAMKRPGGRDSYRRLIEEIRSRAPEAALRSSFIVGFPGETDDDVEDLVSFLEEVELDWAGFFPYSAEAGTPAAELADQVPAEEVGERLRHLQSCQDAITDEQNRLQIGRRTTVLVDQIEDGTPVARSFRHAPEIDGVITLDAGRPGEWREVEITAAFGSDLEADVVSERVP
ncbi:MAG TPA: 30S ribosomal protein S12 methylthiotransferase RimO [Acidimicrobiia bacterium]|nr:30S ribosomal protein S12 methylthiotransferase RimO [Acidimicrobiia bacterium]